MKYFLISIVVMMLVSASFSVYASESSSKCPDETLGETISDCPWAGISRDLDQSAQSGQDLEQLLRQNAPELVRQIEIDSTNEVLKSIWGYAVNIDESMKAQIVSPATIDLLNKLSKAPNRNGIIVPAGIQHTYSYLFSNLKTSFGYKRARWVKPDIEIGFGLPSGVIAPIAKEGTFFANATYFIGQIAYRGHEALLKYLDSAKNTVAQSVVNFDFNKMESIRLVERTGDIEIQTDFVKFANNVPDSTNSYLLVYSVTSPFYGNSQRLISAFPVDAQFVKRATDPSKLGDNRPIQSRYNAYLPELTNGPLLGSREVILLH